MSFLEGLLVFILSLLVEAVFGAIFEFVAYVLVRAIPSVRRVLASTSLPAVTASAAGGMVLGLVSMFFRPMPVTTGDTAAFASVLLAPIPMAAGMVVAGRILESRSIERNALDHWVPALAFAYAFVLTRVMLRLVGPSAA